MKKNVFKKIQYFIISFLLTTILIGSAVGAIVVMINDKNQAPAENVFSVGASKLDDSLTMQEFIDVDALRAYVKNANEFINIAFGPIGDLYVNYAKDAVSQIKEFFSYIVSPPTIREDRAQLV